MKKSFNKQNNNFKYRNTIRNRRGRRNFRRFPRRRIINNKNSNKQKEKIQNKKINNLEQKMKNLTINERRVTNLNPYFNKVKAYIDALLNPEKFINSGIKIPNPLSTYSYCYGFKEQFNLTPGEDGNFTLIWFPNIFSCVDYTIGNDTTYGGTDADIGVTHYTFQAVRRYAYTVENTNLRNWIFPSTHIMQTPMEGYRLVSASILIRYIGKVINKSGYIISAPTYRDYGTWASRNTLNFPFTLSTDFYPKYDETILNNTRGSFIKYIVNDNYLKRLYVPLDSFDTAFEDPGFYYSITTSKQGYEKFDNAGAAKETKRYNEVTINQNPTLVRYLKPEEGNPLKYVFLGKGFDNTQPDSIIVTAYYNFECIPVEGVVVPNNNNNTYNLRTSTQEAVFNELKNIINEDPVHIDKKKIVKKVKIQ
jgi:hypothetical protein